MSVATFNHILPGDAQYTLYSVISVVAYSVRLFIRIALHLAYNSVSLALHYTQLSLSLKLMDVIRCFL